MVLQSNTTTVVFQKYFRNLARVKINGRTMLKFENFLILAHKKYVNITISVKGIHTCMVQYKLKIGKNNLLSSTSESIFDY